MESCPQGIKNEKDIERLEDRFTMMLDQVNKNLEKLDKKLDTVNNSLENLKKNLPAQIEHAVEDKWKIGVYGIVKWLIITVFGTAIIYLVRSIFGG